MANPNIVNVTTINGGNAGFNLTATTTATLMTVSGSGVIVKVNRITVANVDGTSAADVSVKVVKAAFTSAATGGAGNVGTIYLAKTISVPADASLVLLDTPIYMQEGDALQGGASATSDLELFVSYDVIA